MNQSMNKTDITSWKIRIIWWYLLISYNLGWLGNPSFPKRAHFH